MTSETTVVRVLRLPTSSWLERVVGIISMGIALLLALDSWKVCSAILGRLMPISASLMVLVGLLLALTLLFVVVGHRLVFRQRHRSGSLLAPWVWFAISAAFLAVVCLVSIDGSKQPKIEFTQGILGTLLLSLLAYGAGSHFRRKARERRNAA